MSVQHLELPIGERVTVDDVEYVRTPIQNPKSSYPNNYYYAPLSCYCNVCEEGSECTHEDEWGSCDFCDGNIRQVFGHNDNIELNDVREEIENYLIALQSGKLGIPTLEQLQNAGNLHIILAGENS